MQRPCGLSLPQTHPLVGGWSPTTTEDFDIIMHVKTEALGVTELVCAIRAPYPRRSRASMPTASRGRGWTRLTQLCGHLWKTPQARRSIKPWDRNYEGRKHCNISESKIVNYVNEPRTLLRSSAHTGVKCSKL